MNILLIIFSALIILTKFADCYTTAYQIGINTNLERNPVARYIMRKLGVQFTIWAIFVFTIFITIIAMNSVLEADSLLYEIIFLITALFVSIFQFFVALYNYTKRPNIITGILSKTFK